MKKNMWNRIAAIGMAFGMLAPSMPVLAFEDVMIEVDDTYIIAEEDTEAVIEPEADGGFFDDDLIADEEDLETDNAGETGLLTDETEEELYAAAEGDIPIDEAHFPDDAFREIIGSVDYDRDRNGVLSSNEIADITELDISWLEITSLEGVEYCSYLTTLSCGCNQLVSLDVSKNTALECLDCQGNQLTGLDVSKNSALKYLDCNSNQLTSLDVSKNTALVGLYCYFNEITSLRVSENTALEELDCRRNPLTSLDISKNTALQHLSCGSNQLTNLDVSKNTVLQYLSCSDNQLTNLDVSKNTDLSSLYCDRNLLSSLDVSKNKSLKQLECSNNDLTGLNISNNTALEYLACIYNRLTNLNVSKNKVLSGLFCAYNQMTNLNISNCPNLEYAYHNGQCIPYGDIVTYTYNGLNEQGDYIDSTLSYDSSVELQMNEIEDPDDPIIVVSLGDSYSSGEGIEPFYGQDLPISVKVDDRDWLSHRSQYSWPGLLKVPGIEEGTTLKDYKYDPNLTTESLKKQDCIWYFRAVSGAETKHFNQEKQKKTVRQFERNFKIEEKSLPLQFHVFDEIKNRDLGTVDYVTLSVGGNDVGFVDIITICAMESTYLGSKTLEKRLDRLWENIDTTMNNIRNVYYGILERTSPETKIIVAGYPKLLDVNGKGAAISRKEATLVNQKVTVFNSKIWELVNECSNDMNIYYVDIETEFGTTHQAYSNKNWINEIYLGPEEQDLDHLSKASSYSMHPNKTGAEHYAKAVNAKIEEIAGSGN